MVCRQNRKSANDTKSCFVSVLGWTCIHQQHIPSMSPMSSPENPALHKQATALHFCHMLDVAHTQTYEDVHTQKQGGCLSSLSSVKKRVLMLYPLMPRLFRANGLYTLAQCRDIVFLICDVYKQNVIAHSIVLRNETRHIR